MAPGIEPALANVVAAGPHHQRDAADHDEEQDCSSQHGERFLPGAWLRAATIQFSA
jgi:hypothetical protein